MLLEIVKQNQVCDGVKDDILLHPGEAAGQRATTYQDTKQYKLCIFLLNVPSEYHGEGSEGAELFLS
jgi:hypothetical protein